MIAAHRAARFAQPGDRRHRTDRGGRPGREARRRETGPRNGARGGESGAHPGPVQDRQHGRSRGSRPCARSAACASAAASSASSPGPVRSRAGTRSWKWRTGQGSGGGRPARRRLQAAHQPYSFQGLKEKGLELLAEARAATGLAVVTEVMATEQVELVAAYADVLQVGARNMQNYPLLEAVGERACRCCSSAARRRRWTSSCWRPSTSSRRATRR